MTTLNLDEIEKACAAATAGRWLYANEPQRDIITGQLGHYVLRDGTIAKVLDPADARFIASARQWVPELVAEVRLLREQLKAERDAAALDLEVNLQRASTDD